MTIKHVDFEIPFWGELAAGPTGGAYGALSQVSAASFPDRGSVGVRATMTAGGTAGEYVEHDLTAAQMPVYVRLMVKVSGVANGSVRLIEGRDALGALWWVAYNSATGVLSLSDGSTTLQHTLHALAWHCVEVAITAGSFTLWVNGIAEATDTSIDYSGHGPRYVRVGCIEKDNGTTGTLDLDEWIISASYVGPVVVAATAATAADAARWLCLYDGADADSVAWAASYVAARSVPYSCLCDVHDLVSATIDVAGGELTALRSHLSDYISNNGLTDVIGYLVGYGVPKATNDGRSTAEALTGDVAANAHYTSGAVDTDGLPSRASLIAGRKLVAEIDATLPATANALPTVADALIAMDAAAREFSAIDPASDAARFDAASWAALDTFTAAVVSQQIRIPATGSGNGNAIELTDDTSGTFSGSQTKAIMATVGDAGAAHAIAAIDDGYAFAAAFVGSPDADELPNPAALIAALRAGWTFAEAIAVATPYLDCGIRWIGDPLGRCLLPLQGYNVYQRSTRAGSASLVAVVPAGVVTIDLDGYANDSEQFVHVESVNKCGVEDDEPLRLVRVAFDDDGDLILPVPNAPEGLKLTRHAGGVVKAVWTYTSNGQGAAPSQFNLYVASAGDSIDYTTASQTVSAATGRSYTATLGTFNHGVVVECGIRAAAASGAEEPNTTTVSTTADALPPDQPASLTVEVA